MIRYIKEDEIQFLHGRVSSNVFMEHYFNPALIVDLRARALEGIENIREKDAVT